MLLNVREVDMQLEEEMRTSGRSRGGGRMTIRRCGKKKCPARYAVQLAIHLRY